MSSKALIIPAAGSGRRMQRKLAKPFIELAGKTILSHTIHQFLELDGLNQIVVATSAEYIGRTKAVLQRTVGNKIAWQCIGGGSERQDSVYKALQMVDSAELVLVHDAVRPFVQPDQVATCCREAEKTGAAILGVPGKDTIKKVDPNQFVEETPDRKLMWQVQTPQVFRTEILKRAYHRADEENYFGTDDASLVEWIGEPVKVIEGSWQNIKITYPQDLEYAKVLLRQKNK